MGDLPTVTITTPGWFTSAGYHNDLATLRRDAPLHRSTEGWWLLSRYDEVRAVSRDPQRFRSGAGVLVNDPLREPGGGAAAGFVSILHMDPPLHTTYRKLLHREFTPRAVLRHEERVRRIVIDALDAAVVDEPIDIVEHLAAPVPIGVICELLGVPDTDRAAFRRWSDATIEIADRSEAQRAADAEDLASMAQFLLELIRSPAAEDVSLLARLKSFEIDGRRLSTAEIMGFCITLLIAGNETTRALISGGLAVLAEHPDQRAQLAADPTLLPDAIEELLRWVTPIQAFCRTVAEPTTLAGQSLAPEDIVVLLYASANRDEDVFGADAATFDVTRRVDQSHLSFGFGEHVCLGAALARMEARIVFEEVLARFPGYEVAGPASYVPSTLTSSIESMPVLLRPR